MSWRFVLLLTPGLMGFEVATGQPVTRYELAIVALTEDEDVRVDFENGLAEKFRENDYDAVASHTIIPDISGLSAANAVPSLSDAGVQGIVMMKPAAVGPGSTLESVKDDVSSEVYGNMRTFARQISPTHSDDELVAVLHTAIYMIRGERTELLSSGAVWLDEPVETQEEGIEKLQDLIVLNMNKARPAIREYLGLPPLPE